MHKSSLLALSLTCLTSLSTAQQSSEPPSESGILTFYGPSLKPAPTDQPSDVDRLGSEELLNAGIIPLGGRIEDASAVGIDVGGRTIYVGMHEYSVTVSTVSGELTTVTLPTPTSEAITLFARPTGFYYRKYGVSLTNDQNYYEGTLNYFCEHDLEQNTALEDAIVVCRKAFDGQGRFGTRSIPRTEIEALTVGNAVPIATITNAPESGVDLPTLGLGPSGFSTIVVQPPTSEGSALSQGKNAGVLGLVASSVAMLLYHVL